MQYSKELPQIPSGEKWWGSVEKPSKRLIVEHLAMSTLFDLKGPVQLDLPKSSWDVDKIIISTGYFELKRLEDQCFNLGFFANFSMDDGGRLCNPNDRWNMCLFLPVNYPFYGPSVSFYTKERWITDPVSNRGVFNFGGVGYRLGCHCSTAFHNPGFTTCLRHAQQAICWLRSRLDSEKNNGYAMKQYEGVLF